MNKAKWRKLYNIISAVVLIGTFCLAVAAVVWLELAIPEDADGPDKLAIGVAAGLLGFFWLAATAVEFCIYFALKYFLFETKKTKGIFNYDLNV